MKFDVKIDWPWMFHKVRILFLLGIFYVLYTYVGSVWAFIWALYFIYNDLTDIETDVDEIKTKQEERDKPWKDTSHRRKGF